MSVSSHSALVHTLVGITPVPRLQMLISQTVDTGKHALKGRREKGWHRDQAGGFFEINIDTSLLLTGEYALETISSFNNLIATPH